jgi:hypothetical protein
MYNEIALMFLAKRTRTGEVVCNRMTDFAQQLANETVSAIKGFLHAD